MELTPRELARLLELNKKKAELEFRHAAFGTDCAAELRSIEANASELAAKAKAAVVEIILPNDNRLRELGEALSTFSPQQLREAMTLRSGTAYELLRQRGEVVKRNQDNRLEIAKLAMTLSRMPSHDRDLLAAAVKSGSLGGTMRLDFTSEGIVKDAARFMRRCGMGCRALGRSLVADTQPPGEVRMEFANRNVWVSADVRGKLEENLAKIGQLTAGIQLKNAERQIKRFNEQEESEFEALQRQYLDLLKQQDELLREFNEEENIQVKP